MNNLLRLRQNTTGAVLVEYLVAMGFVIPLIVVSCGLLKWWTCALDVQHAAVMVARRAAVLLPDDPTYHGGSPVDVYGEVRAEELEQYAQVALGESAKFWAAPKVTVRWDAPHAIETTITLRPTWRWLDVLPSSLGQIAVHGSAVYQGAHYEY